MYASIYHDKAYYIFSGRDMSNIIARMDEVSRTWSRAGTLKQNRERHNVIFDGLTFMVIGGEGKFKTENCLLEGTVMTCTEQQSSALDNYYDFPALFLTADNYGDDCWICAREPFQ